MMHFCMQCRVLVPCTARCGRATTRRNRHTTHYGLCEKFECHVARALDNHDYRLEERRQRAVRRLCNAPTDAFVFDAEYERRTRALGRLLPPVKPADVHVHGDSRMAGAQALGRLQDNTWKRLIEDLRRAVPYSPAPDDET